MLKRIAIAAMLLLATLSVASSPTIDAHFLNTSGFDAVLSVDGKVAVDCKQGGMCDFKITRGKHAFNAKLAKGGESSGEFTIPAEFKMVCVAVYPNKKMDFSGCGQ
jgi:hypothetical protein